MKDPERGRSGLVRAAGFEPATFGFGGQHSIQLSYARTALDGIAMGPKPVNEEEDASLGTLCLDFLVSTVEWCCAGFEPYPYRRAHLGVDGGGRSSFQCCHEMVVRMR